MYRSDDFADLQSLLAGSPRTPLGADEERQLLDEARRGSRAALDALCRRNGRLVIAVARRYGAAGLRLEDLVQEGYLGLLEALRRFEPERGFRFSTYAVWWVRAYVRRAIRHHEDLGEVSLNDLPDETSGFTAPALRDDHPLPDETAMQGEVRHRVREAIRVVSAGLSPLARNIVERRMTAEQPETLEDIGRDFRLSRERVRQVETLVRKRLARHLNDFGEVRAA